VGVSVLIDILGKAAHVGCYEGSDELRNYVFLGVFARFSFLKGTWLGLSKSKRRRRRRYSKLHRRGVRRVRYSCAEGFPACARVTRV
jgi:hypothetical protein